MSLEEHPVGGFTEAMKDRLAMRLLLRPDRSDRGQTLSRTAAALAMPSGSAEEAASRVVYLVTALAAERLIVPIQIEQHPQDPDHRPLDPGRSPLRSIDGPHGPSVVAFTSTEELQNWDPKARPTPQSSARVAIGALAIAGSALNTTVTINPGSPDRIILPRSAVLALASADIWLPAWQDDELKLELTSLAQSALAEIVAIRLKPADAYGQIGWDGGIRVELLIDVGGVTLEQNESFPVRLAAAMRAVSESERLLQSAQSIELVPCPISRT